VLGALQVVSKDRHDRWRRFELYGSRLVVFVKRSEAKALLRRRDNALLQTENIMRMRFWQLRSIVGSRRPFLAYVFMMRRIA